MTAGAQTASLYIRGYNEYFGCYMASIERVEFFNTYLPISPDLLAALDNGKGG